MPSQDGNLLVVYVETSLQQEYATICRSIENQQGYYLKFADKLDSFPTPVWACRKQAESLFQKRHSA